MIATGTSPNQGCNCGCCVRSWSTGGNSRPTGGYSQLSPYRYNSPTGECQETCISAECPNGSVLFRNSYPAPVKAKPKPRQKKKLTLPDVLTYYERFPQRRDRNSARSSKKYNIQRMRSYVVGATFWAPGGRLLLRSRIL